MKLAYWLLLFLPFMAQAQEVCTITGTIKKLDNTPAANMPVVVTYIGDSVGTFVSNIPIVYRANSSGVLTFSVIRGANVNVLGRNIIGLTGTGVNFYVPQAATSSLSSLVPAVAVPSNHIIAVPTLKLKDADGNIVEIDTAELSDAFVLNTTVFPNRIERNPDSINLGILDTAQAIRNTLDSHAISIAAAGKWNQYDAVGTYSIIVPKNSDSTKTKIDNAGNITTAGRVDITTPGRSEYAYVYSAANRAYFGGTAGTRTVLSSGNSVNNPSMYLDPAVGTVWENLTGGGAGEKMRLTASGKLGIGIADPANRLEVAGHGKFDSTLTGNGTLRMNNGSAHWRIEFGSGYTGQYTSDAMNIQAPKRLALGSNLGGNASVLGIPTADSAIVFQSPHILFGNLEKKVVVVRPDSVTIYKPTTFLADLTISSAGTNASLTLTAPSPYGSAISLASANATAQTHVGFRSAGVYAYQAGTTYNDVDFHIWNTTSGKGFRIHPAGNMSFFSPTTYQYSANFGGNLWVNPDSTIYAGHYKGTAIASGTRFSGMRLFDLKASGNASRDTLFALHNQSGNPVMFGYDWDGNGTTWAIDVPVILRTSILRNSTLYDYNGNFSANIQPGKFGVGGVFGFTSDSVFTVGSPTLMGGIHVHGGAKIEGSVTSDESVWVGNNGYVGRPSGNNLLFGNSAIVPNNAFGSVSNNTTSRAFFRYGAFGTSLSYTTTNKNALDVYGNIFQTKDSTLDAGIVIFPRMIRDSSAIITGDSAKYRLWDFSIGPYLSNTGHATYSGRDGYAEFEIWWSEQNFDFSIVSDTANGIYTTLIEMESKYDGAGPIFNYAYGGSGRTLQTAMVGSGSLPYIQLLHSSAAYWGGFQTYALSHTPLYRLNNMPFICNSVNRGNRYAKIKVHFIAQGTNTSSYYVKLANI